MPNLARLRGSRSPGRTRNTPSWGTAQMGHAGLRAVLWGPPPGAGVTRKAKGGTEQALEGLTLLHQKHGRGGLCRTVAWARLGNRGQKPVPPLTFVQLCCPRAGGGRRGPSSARGAPLASGNTGGQLLLEGSGAEAMPSLRLHEGPLHPVFLTCRPGGSQHYPPSLPF